MNDRLPSLTVRIKLVNLNGTGNSSSASSLSSPARVSALIASNGESRTASPVADIQPISLAGYPAGEICLEKQHSVHYSDFENHIEACTVCSNRVQLQLDFIETLEAAVCQRAVEPESPKVRGALLISAPKLNFALCGELEVSN